MPQDLSHFASSFNLSSENVDMSSGGRRIATSQLSVVGITLTRLKALGPQQVLQDFLGFPAESCDSFLTALRGCLSEWFQATLDYAPLESFNGQQPQPTTFEKDL
jgi:hypothetical protein